jgi:MoxR-like ATPase
MERLLGDQLKDNQLLTDGQLKQALERQRLHGGRLGANLIALGFLSEEQLGTFFHRRPHSPQSIEETGLRRSFVVDLVTKHLFALGECTLHDVVERVKLSTPIIDEVLEEIQRNQMVEVKGSSGLGRMTYRYILTDRGKARAQELFGISRYAGPAPVPLAAYRRMIEVQTVKNIIVKESRVLEAFSHLIVSNKLLTRLGPAISSGRALFLYGPPGNGKTAIAETIARVMPDHVYIPYAVLVDDDVIMLYDPVTHVAVNQESSPESELIKQDIPDARWLEIERPVVMAGGELDLSMLDLEFNDISRFYQAPLQMKANNGIFIVDDFGRQQMDPQDLLNRWIVPLERHTDFLSLQSGMKFEIPFDQLVIFSTNLEPKKLVDEAFLRRIRYKIKIDHPAEHEYERIFKAVCESNGIEYRQEMVDFLLERFYRRSGRSPNACHPRDLIDHIIDDAHYHCYQPELTEASLTAAWETYFVEI